MNQDIINKIETILDKRFPDSKKEIRAQARHEIVGVIDIEQEDTIIDINESGFLPSWKDSSDENLYLGSLCYYCEEPYYNCSCPRD